MINHWELANRIDPVTGMIHYTLLTDGTEQDARLIARKLKGYVKGVTSAQAPHVYAFELPCDIDEDTQDKLRTAVEEGVSLTHKVNELVPGGSLGDPLFSANALTGDKNSTVFPTSASSSPEKDVPSASPKRMEVDLSADPSLEVIKEPNEIQVQRVAMGETPESATSTPVSPQEPQLSTIAREVFATRRQPVTEENLLTVPATSRPPAKPASTISISDQDMLLKDMEGSVLSKLPLEDILSADTKLDMFVDVKKTPQPAAATPAARSEQLSAATDSDAFNVFEPEITDADNLLDVAEINTITDKITQKTMDFINEPKKPGDSQLPSVPQEGTKQAKPAQPAVPPVAPHAASPESDSLPEITLRQPNNEPLEQVPDLPPAPAKPAPAKPAPARPQPGAQQPPQKPVLRVRKPATPAQDAEKTVLRLRRKDSAAQNTDTYADPATATHTQIAKPLHSTMSPERAAENLRLAKDKAIDHSIEIPISELKKHNWPLEVPLVPTYTMSNMVMSVNRFAHATAISVIDNPGKLYNPLVLHGGTGTGKTHFLNALAYSFSQKFGQEHIFMTNGVRLSRGIQRYVMEGNIAKFEDFMESVKVLLIDDIHLLAINEQNRESVSKLLHSFLRNQKQIVITSKYPPESLSKLEELINFRLDAGWISELKQATGATHFRIVKKMLIENGVDLNDKQIEEFFGGNHMTLGTVMRSIRRLKVLENLLFKNLEQDTKSQAGIFEKLLATKGEDPSSELTTKDPDEVVNITPTGNGEWGRIGIFYPQNCSNMMSWIVYALGQRAKELNIPGGFDIVVRSSYATENIISSAFKIANLCDNKKLKGAIILGPQPTACDPSVRENFYDILTHMLEIMLIRCGIINFESVRLPSTYVKLISELMR